MRLTHFIAPAQVILLTGFLWSGQACNFGPGNLGFFNFGTGNVGFLNFGVGNTGVLNQGILNFGGANTGAAQIGVRNIGAFNALAVPNTVSVLNIPLAPNLSPITGRKRRRRRATMKYPAGKFTWRS